MARKVSFSDQHQKLEDIAQYYTDVESALSEYFSAKPLPRFHGYTQQEIADELEVRLIELEQTSIFMLLSAVEATFRIAYLHSVYTRKKDSLSKAFRQVYTGKRERASLEDDILTAWRDTRPEVSRLVSDLRTAFRYRHWLAHGRYWAPKIGKQIDYRSAYELAQAAIEKLQP